MAFARTNLDDRSKTHMLSNLPDDSISHVRWSASSNPLLISAGSWDKTLRIWKISPSIGNTVTSEMVALFRQEAPVLTSCFSSDNTKLFGGGCSNTVLSYDLNNVGSPGMVVARHQKPVNGVYWASIYNVCITTSWDGMVCIWDGRQERPVWSDNVCGKVFASDFKPNLMCAADNNGKIHAWNLEKMQVSNNKITIDSTLKSQLRSLSLFPDVSNNPGVVYTSIGGRCVVSHFMESSRSQNFSFKCHRVGEHPKVVTYSVNAIDFHTMYGTFVSGGGDGTYAIWDKDAKSRVKMSNNMNAPIVDVKFSSQNNLLAYATSYDWHKGLDKMLMMNTIKSVGIVKLKEEDLKSRNKTYSVGRR